MRVKFTDMTPFHVSTGRNYYDSSRTSPQSDSISAALASIRAQTGKTDDLLEFMESFVVSSAFPYSGERYFLPRLIGNVNVEVEGQDVSQYRKKLKKVKWIEHSLWEKLTTSPTCQTIKDGQIKGAFLLAQDGDFSNPQTSQITQRVSVKRDDGEQADPFFFDWVYTAPDCGLYCLVKADDSIKEELCRLFRALGLNGFGSDKNVGGGHFDVQIDEMEIAEAEGSNAKVLLSMYLPSKEEASHLDFPASYYQLSKRGGFMAGSNEDCLRHLRKKNIYMFEPGSVLVSDQNINGRIVELSPDWDDYRMHPVYRSGQAFSVSIKL